MPLQEMYRLIKFARSGFTSYSWAEALEDAQVVMNFVVDQLKTGGRPAVFAADGFDCATATDEQLCDKLSSMLPKEGDPVPVMGPFLNALLLKLAFTIAERILKRFQG